jgi:hypothetical protein
MVLEACPVHLVARPLQPFDEVLGEHTLVPGVSVLINENSHALPSFTGRARDFTRGFRLRASGFGRTSGKASGFSKASGF